MTSPGHLKLFHEFSLASRSRIRRVLRNVEREVQANSSDDEIQPIQQPPIRNIDGNAQLNDELRAQRLSSSEAEQEFGNVNDEEGGNDRNANSTAESANEIEQEGEINRIQDIEENRRDTSSESAGEEGPHDTSETGGESVSENSGNESNSDRDENNAGGNEPEMDGDEEGIDENNDDEGEPDVDGGKRWYGDNDAQLYDLAPITLSESMYAILCFYLRHNLSQTCLNDLLGLINLHCRQEGNIFPKTMYHFKKLFSIMRLPVVKHFFCHECFQNLGDLNLCMNCGTAKGDTFFIEIPILEQLRALFKRQEFVEKLRHRMDRRMFVDGNFEDIYDGNVYKQLSDNNGILSDPTSISLMWYSDGVSIFKSSKYELWPFYFVINELPYNDRTKVSNALLAGLWFGKKKPVPSTFLKPIRQDIMRLRRGVNMRVGDEVINVKGIVISGTADIPAKAVFLNLKGHNGQYGCAKCKIRSVNIRRGLNVYPFQMNLALRTDAETLLHARYATELPLANGLRQDVYGVKGPSILSTFVHKVVSTTAVDVMHCVYLGIVKALLHFWFSPTCRDEDFSLSLHKRLVNDRLSKITPPDFVQRLTRTLDDVKYWKGHELKSFLFYYSIPVLYDIMNDTYLDHHKLLVVGIYLLNQRSVSEDMIALASDLLTEYVSQFDALYGDENMTCNLHQLLHLSSVVRDLGPLWVTSCFPFEDLNGKLKHLVKGTRYAELQVSAGVSMLVKFAELKQNMAQGGSAFEYGEKLFQKNRGQKFTNIGNRMAIVGKFVKRNELPELVQEAVNRSNIQGRNFYEFYRLKKFNTTYGSQTYRRALKSKSFCVKYLYNMEERVGFVQSYLKVTDCECEQFCENCDATYLAIVNCFQTRQDFSAWEGVELNFIHTLQEAVDLRY